MLHEGFYFVFDLETGGLWAHNNPILEIAVIVLDVNLKEVERYEAFIKPYKGKEGNELYVDAQALQSNGIKMEEVMSKGIDIKDMVKDLKLLSKKYKFGKWGKPVLVGHNAATFDINFLEYVFDLFEPRGKAGVPVIYSYFERSVIDTLTFSRLKWGHIDVENHQLGSTCARLGIELIDAHRAMADTEATSKVFCYFINMWRGIGISEIDQTQNQQKQENKFRKTFKFRKIETK